MQPQNEEYFFLLMLSKFCYHKSKTPMSVQQWEV